MKKTFEVIENGYIRSDEFEIIDELEYSKNRNGMYVATKRSKIKNFFRNNEETFVKVGTIAGGIASWVIVIAIGRKL